MIYDRAFPLPPSTDAYGNHFPGQSGMSVREYAAIALRIPDSGDFQLDQMIRRARRDELAERVLAGSRGNPSYIGMPASIYALDAYEIADAMIAEGEKVR